MTGGQNESRCMVLSGMQGAGKTAMVMAYATAMARRGKRVLVVVEDRDHARDVMSRHVEAVAAFVVVSGLAHAVEAMHRQYDTIVFDLYERHAGLSRSRKRELIGAVLTRQQPEFVVRVDN